MSHDSWQDAGRARSAEDPAPHDPGAGRAVAGGAGEGSGARGDADLSSDQGAGAIRPQQVSDAVASPADELRRAAATIRARAETATPGPWGVDDSFDTVYSDARAGRTVAHTYDSGPDSKHIVLWSPLAALAVASWLDFAATYAESGNEIPATRGQGLAQALDVARLISWSAS